MLKLQKYAFHHSFSRHLNRKTILKLEIQSETFQTNNTIDARKVKKTSTSQTRELKQCTNQTSQDESSDEDKNRLRELLTYVAPDEANSLLHILTDTHTHYLVTT